MMLELFPAIRNGWDYLLVFPIIQNYLRSHGFPHDVSMTAIEDSIIEKPELRNTRIVRMEWCISHALREMGYRRDSNSGRRFTKTNLGIIVPLGCERAT